MTVNVVKERPNRITYPVRHTDLFEERKQVVVVDGVKSFSRVQKEDVGLAFGVIADGGIAKVVNRQNILGAIAARNIALL